jgi:uncharacterized membrane protein YphA (DoxX/SURF4 family)
MGLGVLFLLGLLVRFASLGGLVLMAAATYVHVVVDDPALFPLQPEQPIVPVVAGTLCLYLLRVGAGSWSLDLRTRGGDRDVVPASRTASRGGVRVEVEPSGGHDMSGA